MEEFFLNSDSDPNSPLFTIGFVAELLNISVHTLRLYEKEGLIIPFKKDSKHRLYTKNDILRLKCIREAITEKKFSLSAINAMYSLIPCWSIQNCSDADRSNCEAYGGILKPCWTYKHLNNICATLQCNQCEVYTRHSQCDKIKKTIIEKTNNK